MSEPQLLLLVRLWYLTFGCWCLLPARPGSFRVWLGWASVAHLVCVGERVLPGFLSGNGLLFGSKRSLAERKAQVEQAADPVGLYDDIHLSLVTVHIFTDGTKRDNIGINSKTYPKADYPELFAAVKDFALSLPNEALDATSMTDKRTGVEWSQMIHITPHNLTAAQGKQLRALVGPAMSKRKTEILDALRAERK